MRTTTTTRRNPAGRRTPSVSSTAPDPLRAAGVAGLAAGAGAVAEYLFDPDRGRARRARVRDRIAHTAHDGNEGLDVLARDLANRTRGVAAGTRYRVTGRRVDDTVLHERVRSELGRYVTHPHAVEVGVDGGMVTLRGDVLADEARRARRGIGRVPGVRGVDERWTVHRDSTGVPRLQGARRPRQPVPELLQQHWSPAARFVAGTSGAALWTVSGRLPRPASWAVGGAGALLAVRAATNLPIRRLTGVTAGRRAVDVQDSISVAASPERLWSFLGDYSTLPGLLPDVLDVRRSPDGRRSHWVVAGPAGVPVRFDAEETRREDGRELAWRTVDRQLVAHSGVVRLDPEDGGRTRIHVRLTYNPMVGAVGHAVATLFGADPAHRLRQDLMRIKSFVETGAAGIVEAWPAESQEAARLVIDQYGEPHEATESQLIWHQVGPWKRVVASRAFYQHAFPAPHFDSVESFIDFRVPVEKVSELTAFDGSVMVERTAGEVSARCHDEQANFLALNLMNDIVTGAKTVEQARARYAEEFLDHRRKQPTPYMERLRFSVEPGTTADPDQRVLTDEDLDRAVEEGRTADSR
ncbi:SRPBCC family protein [Jiangella aurantiaca]|nr:SRPBCC family protein [Jiangella aurantiaca]